MKKRIINGLIVCGFLFLAFALKMWIFPTFKYVSMIQALLVVPGSYFAILAVFPQKSIKILSITIVIVICVIVFNLPGNWQEIFYKVIATVLSGLVLWLFKKILTAKSV